MTETRTLSFQSQIGQKEKPIKTSNALYLRGTKAFYVVSYDDIIYFFHTNNLAQEVWRPMVFAVL